MQDTPIKTEAKEFIEYLWKLTEYWNDENRRKTKEECLQGLVFSILTTIDGYAVGHPGFRLYVQGTRENIAGNLHDNFFEFKPEHKKATAPNP